MHCKQRCELSSWFVTCELVYLQADTDCGYIYYCSWPASVLMMTVTESVTVTLVAVRCVTSWLFDVWMAVVQPVSATEAVHCVAVVVYPPTVSDVWWAGLENSFEKTLVFRFLKPKTSKVHIFVFLFYYYYYFYTGHIKFHMQLWWWSVNFVVIYRKQCDRENIV